jgi:hypothetical protein
MDDVPNPTKAERFAEFLRRLEVVAPASTFDEAYQQLSDVLNAVEDELTSIPFDPANWQNDGRMYPPQLDNLGDVAGRSDVKQFRSRAHKTLIGDNGAIEIRELSGRAVLTKPGADGRTV